MTPTQIAILSLVSIFYLTTAIAFYVISAGVIKAGYGKHPKKIAFVCAAFWPAGVTVTFTLAVCVVIPLWVYGTVLRCLR